MTSKQKVEQIFTIPHSITFHSAWSKQNMHNKSTFNQNRVISSTQFNRSQGNVGRHCVLVQILLYHEWPCKIYERLKLYPPLDVRGAAGGQTQTILLHTIPIQSRHRRTFEQADGHTVHSHHSCTMSCCQPSHCEH